MRLKTVLFLLFVVSVVAANRVLLRDVTSITLHRGEYTTGRRSRAVPQLECVGGTAQGKFSPKTVQCYNRGFDGIDPQWECTAEMPLDYQFGRISVTCEGYDYAEDPYVLAGSCGLKYELDYSTSGAKRTAHPVYGKQNDTNYTSIIYFVIIVFVLYLLYTTLTSTREGNEGDRNRGGFWPGDDPDGNDRRPPPPGFRPYPPSYDETCNNKNTGSTNRGSTNNTGASNFGFLSGLGLGGLGGYLFNNYWNRNNYGDTGVYRRRPRPTETQFERDTGFYSSNYDRPSTSRDYSSSSTTHTSSGFGGTERR